MAGVNKEAFLASIAGGEPAGDAAPMPEEEYEGESLSCGEQLVRALGLDVDPGPVDDALREAVRKYSEPVTPEV